MKTKWQKIYSFFGFWSYETPTHRVWYWCMFPWFLWIRKINLVKVKK